MNDMNILYTIEKTIIKTFLGISLDGTEVFRNRCETYDEWLVVASLFR